MTATTTDLERFARETVTLLRRVNELIVDTDAHLTEDTGGKPSKRAVFPAPWNTPAGHTFTTIAQAGRDHEQNLELLLFSRARFHGTSDVNTYKAIERLPVLLSAAVRADHAKHNYVTSAITDLCRWPAQLRRFLDDDPEDNDPQPWTKAPGELSCPHCNRRLWLRPGWQHQGASASIYCRHCRDEHGHMLRWPADAWLAVLQHAEGA